MYIYIYNIYIKKSVEESKNKRVLTNSQRKTSPQLLDQSKRKYISIFALPANTFQSDKIEYGW